MSKENKVSEVSEAKVDATEVKEDEVKAVETKTVPTGVAAKAAKKAAAKIEAAVEVKEEAPAAAPVEKVYSTPQVETKPAGKDLGVALNLVVGSKVMIKEGAKTVSGATIPAFAFNNVYKVTKILEDRVIIAVNTLKFGLKPEDVIPVLD